MCAALACDAALPSPVPDHPTSTTLQFTIDKVLPQSLVLATGTGSASLPAEPSLWDLGLPYPAGDGSQLGSYPRLEHLREQVARAQQELAAAEQQQRQAEQQRKSAQLQALQVDTPAEVEGMRAALAANPLVQSVQLQPARAVRSVAPGLQVYLPQKSVLGVGEGGGALVEYVVLLHLGGVMQELRVVSGVDQEQLAGMLRDAAAVVGGRGE